MNFVERKRNFFWKSSAQKFAAELKAKGLLAQVWPAHYFGPRDCFSWGWQVAWQEAVNEAG